MRVPHLGREGWDQDLNQACQAQGPCSESLVLLHVRTGASEGL